MIYIGEDDLKRVRAILKAHVPDCMVLAFGSRVKGTHRLTSDLDIAIVGDAKLPFGTIGAIKEDFMESDLPFRVDVLDYHGISTEFRAVIDEEHEVIS